MLLDLRASPSMRPLEQAGLERLAARITEECARPPAASAQCGANFRRVQSSLCTLVHKPPTQDTALNYWHPGASPQEQSVDGKAVLQAAASRFPVLGELLAPDAPASDNQAGANAAASAGSDAAGAANGNAGTGAPMVIGSIAGAPAATTQAQVLPVPPMQGAGYVAPQGPFTPAALQACARSGNSGNSTLYIHIYSESTRMAATALRQTLQPEEGVPLLVAPIENVVRNAELRQQRPPVPWPNPTLVLHDPASRNCARAIAAAVGAPWHSENGTTRVVRLRSLPASLQARPGVLELWLPPLEPNADTEPPSVR